jgi:hypothetical protein
MILLLLLILAVPAVAQEPFAAWKYRGSVEAPGGRFVALPLDARNLDLCDKRDLSDLRVTDQRGVELPYAVVFETELQTQTEKAGEILNRDYPNESTSRLTVDFRGSAVKNRILVETQGDSFRRRLWVEGSDDLQSWSTLLQEGWLTAAGASPERRFETVDTGANTYRYIRVSVVKMPDEIDRPRILRVTCRHDVTRKASEFAVESRLMAYRTEKGISTAEVDFGTRNLPLQRLRLILARDPARIFMKSCDISGRSTLQHVERVRFETAEYGRETTIETPWEPVGRGNVFRDQQGKVALDLPGTNFRYVRIRIEDRDSPPLELREVMGYGVPTYLVFEPAGQSRFTLYAGNIEARTPHYESSKVLASLDTRTLPKCRPLNLQPQAGAQPKAPARGQRVVWLVLGVVVAITAWILWKTARDLGLEGQA